MPRAFNFDQEPARIHRHGDRRAIVRVDYAEIELRCVAHALERRAARCGGDSNPSDIFDLSPLDLACD